MLVAAAARHSHAGYWCGLRKFRDRAWGQSRAVPTQMPHLAWVRHFGIFREIQDKYNEHSAIQRMRTIWGVGWKDYDTCNALCCSV